MKKNIPARLFLILSMAIFGTLGPFVRNISGSSGELALYRAILASLMIGIFLLVTGQKIPFGEIRKEIPLLLKGQSHFLSENREESTWKI